MLLGSHQALLTIKHKPTPLPFPESSFDQSMGNTESPGGTMVWSGISFDNKVSVKQIMLQSLFSPLEEDLYSRLAQHVIK